MNNLLLRELPLNATIRLWDTYLSEPDGFNKFHLYVCAAFLCRWKPDLEQKKDFQSILLFIQNVPTAKWHDKVGDPPHIFNINYLAGPESTYTEWECSPLTDQKTN